MKRAFKFLIRDFQFNFFSFAGSVMILAFSFCFIICFYLIGKNIKNSSSIWTNQNEMTIFLTSDVSQNEKNKIETYLDQKISKSEITFLDQGQSFKKMKAELTDALLDTDQDQLIPSLFIIKLDMSLWSNEHLADLSKNLLDFSGVEDVRYGLSWFQTLKPLINSLMGAIALLSLILFFGAYILVSNVIFQRVLMKKKEIELFEMIGATTLEIRKPFFIEAISIVLLSFLIAVGISFALQKGIIFYFQSKLQFFDFKNIQFLGAAEILFLTTLIFFIVIHSTLRTLGRLNQGWISNT